jgi:mono/diheme cytochrome c family protein
MKEATTMNKPSTCRPGRAAMLGLALLAAASATRADDHGPRVPLLPAYQQECGACHVAYPPGLLGAASWQRLMANLPRHFGSDASLDAATATPIGRWLQANAGSGRRVSEAPPEDRITRGAWFQREHREVASATWKSNAVRSASNCAACHTQAEQGSYRERDIRVPR